MLLYTCMQYIIIHFHVSIATICVCFKRTYILLKLYEDMLCISTWIYINTECLGKPALTHACVWIVCSWTCGLYTTCSSLTLDGLYTMNHNTNSTHFNTITVHMNHCIFIYYCTYVYTVFMILWFNAFAEPSIRKYLIYIRALVVSAHSWPSPHSQTPYDTHMSKLSLLYMYRYV